MTTQPTTDTARVLGQIERGPADRRTFHLNYAQGGAR